MKATDQQASSSLDSASRTDAARTPSSPTPADSTYLEPVKIQKATYPLQAVRDGIQGQVWVKMTVSEAGKIDEVEVISGDPILARAAIGAARKWKFKPFIKNGRPIKAAINVPFDFYFSDKVMDKGVATDRSAIMEPKKSASDADRSSAATTGSSASSDTMQVSAGISQGMLIHQVAPVYPHAARLDGIQGTVVLRAVIGKDGRIRDLKPISGPRELIPAAVGAVQQWRYRPYILKGEPVEVTTPIMVNFRLSR